MKVSVNPVKVEVLRQDGRVPGYQAIVPIRGLLIYSQFLQIRNDNPDVVRVAPKHRPDLPRYIPQNKRMSTANAEQVVQHLYPEMDMGYFKLGIAAKGCAEGGVGPVPIAFVHGPTGVAKTSTLRAACSALGEKEFGLITQKQDNLGEALGSGACASSVLVWDEIFKILESVWKASLRPLFLAMTRTFTYRPLYHSTRTVQFNSALFLCDTELPDYVRQDEQFARRVVYVRLTKRVPDWQQTGPDVGDPWWKHNDEVRLAVSSIISDVIDTWFAPGSEPSYERIAADLGFQTLEKSVGESEDGELLHKLMAAVFFAVCDPSTPSAPDEYKLGRGFKELKDDNAIGVAVKALAEHVGISDRNIRSVLIKADGNWHKLVNAKGPARFEQKKHGGKPYVRFADGRGKAIIVNEALLPDDYVSPPVPPAPPSTPLPTTIPSLVATIMTEMSKP